MGLFDSFNPEHILERVEDGQRRLEERLDTIIRLLRTEVVAIPGELVLVDKVTGEARKVGVARKADTPEGD